jgi:hypothetical protein
MSIGLLAVAVPAHAGLIALGDPIPDNSWIQSFQLSFEPSSYDGFDSFEITILTDGGGGPFESPNYITNFSVGGWSLDSGSSTFASASAGSLTETLQFDVYFEGDMDLGVSFALSSYDGGVLNETVQALWTGHNWFYQTDYLRDDPAGGGDPVPEPTTIALTGLGLTLVAGMRRRRRTRETSEA